MKNSNENRKNKHKAKGGTLDLVKYVPYSDLWILLLVHVLVLEARALAILNQVHMRLLVRVGGGMRFFANCVEADFTVRQRLGHHSLDR